MYEMMRFNRSKVTFLCLISAIFAVSSAFTARSRSYHQNRLSPAFFSNASTDSAMVNEVKVGDTIPSVVLKEGQANYEKPVDVNIADLIKGKKVAIFAVPGAFTPGCSK